VKPDAVKKGEPKEKRAAGKINGALTQKTRRDLKTVPPQQELLKPQSIPTEEQTTLAGKGELQS